MHFNKVCFLLLTLFLFATKVYAQQSQTLFGQNRVQHREFNWKLLTTANFDIYFYGNGKELAKQAGRHAEENYNRISEQIGFSNYGKIKLVVYNSVMEMQQSNIGLESDHYTVGGQTHFVKARVEVAFTGNHAVFREEIFRGVASVVINQMLFGGSLKDIVQSSYLLSLPEWFVKGASAYIAHGWSREMDNYMRDLVLNKRIKNPSAYSGEEAVNVGQSIWNFISKRYGRTYMPTIMSLTRIIRNEETSIESIIGVPYGVIIREWENYYISMARELENEYFLPDEDVQLIKKYLGGDSRIKSPVINSEQTRLAFAIEKEGRYRIIVRDLEEGKNKVVKYGGRRLVQQRVDPNIPLLAWQSEHVLGIVEEKKGKPIMTLANVGSGKSNERKLPAFTQIHSFTFSHDGKNMLMSADKEGQSDIFILDMQRNALSQITNDLYDDHNPVFIGKSNEIVFSSNRFDDTLFADINHDYVFRSVKNDFHLYHFQPSDKSQVKRITSAGNNIKPFAQNDDVFYLCDERGILNLYKLRVSEEGSYKQVTAFEQDIEDYSIGKDGAFAFLMRHLGKRRFLYHDNFDFNKSYNTVYTRRAQLALPVKTIKIDEEFKFEDVDEEIPEKKKAEEEEEINIHDYHFESDKKPKRRREEPSAKAGNNDEEEEGEEAAPLEISPAPVYGPYKYKSFFSLERITSSVMVDPWRGMGILMQATMSDIMNNHRITAGIFGLADFRTSNLHAEYKYLKHRVDFGGRYDKETFVLGSHGGHRYTMNRIEGTVSYPFSQHARISVSPFVVHTRITDLVENPATLRYNADVVSLYTGLAYRYVYDNTRLHGLNMPDGTRGLLSLESYVNPVNRDASFNVFHADFRKYKRIHRSLTLAGRASYGHFFGNASHNFMLGGMDNWLMNDLNTSGSRNPINRVAGTTDLLFMRFATNLRGHSYNAQWGNQFFLVNGEIRLPVASYLGMGIVSSNFLRNLQLVGFYDVGTAWSGGNPFDADNITRVDEVHAGGSDPFYATVTNYRSPLLIGYGLGVRTMFLGYYVKMDIAWGIAEQIRQGSTYYLTFGFDF
ncbi:hypothetical protein RCC89_20965 [Cytophagaceae bacterium ABcell3]|nr:hypothetical protein RCC89_20965 [Cytophagaceae bacterium ABcell3]